MYLFICFNAYILFYEASCVLMYIYIYQISRVTKHSILPIAVVYLVKMSLCYDTLFRQQNVRYLCGTIGTDIFPEKQNKNHEVSEHVHALVMGNSSSLS